MRVERRGLLRGLLEPRERELEVGAQLAEQRREVHRRAAGGLQLLVQEMSSGLICEVQLQLKAFHEIKSGGGGGHKKYVQLRDLMGE